MAIKELEYPFDPDYILRKKKAIKRQLTEREGVSYTDKKIAILGGSTTSDIKLILELFLLNYGIRPEFYESEYNQYYEDAVFGNEELDKFSPDLVFIHTTSRNITAYPSVTDSEEDVKALADQTMARFTQIWNKLDEKFHCTIIQNNFEQPYYRLMGNSDVSDIQFRAQGSRDSHVDHQIRMISQDHRLGANSCEDLADPAGRRHDFDAVDRPLHEADPADLLRTRLLDACFDRFHLGSHCSQNADLSDLSHYQEPPPPPPKPPPENPPPEKPPPPPPLSTADDRMSEPTAL